MPKNFRKVKFGGACEAKSMSEDGSLKRNSWVMFNPDSDNFKVLYSVHGELSSSNKFYGNEFANCGSGDIYRETSGETYCDGHDKYVDVYSQVSHDGGSTWETTATTKTLVEKDSADCGGGSGSGSGSGSGGDTYRDISGETYCDGYDKYVDVYSQVSHDGGTTWETTATTKTLVEKDSTDCGYVAETRVVCTYNVGYDGEEIKLFKGGGSGSGSGSGGGGKLPFSDMEIDGVMQSEVVTSYKFDTAGEHTVKFTLVDPTTIDYRAFYECTSLESIVIPDSVTNIAENTFTYCTSLTSIVIPDSVTSIGNSAFTYCRSLTSCTIGSGVTTIGGGAFHYCSGLESIVIPDSVTSVGSSAFDYCSGLTSCTIGSGVTSISNNAFSNCTSLESIVIPDSVTSIGQSAFSNCSGLTSCTIGSGVTSIGKFAFTHCSGLTSVTIGSGVTSIDQSAFAKCRSLTSINIPNSVTSIGSFVFEYCSGLTICTLGSGVTTIGYGAFNECTSLESIDIPDSVTSIGSEAFSNCSGLTSCTIGSDVTSIGSSAFKYCTSLTSIKSNVMTAPTITNGTFQGVKTNGTLYVPIGSSGYDAWMSTGSYYLGNYNWTKVEQ